MTFSVALCSHNGAPYIAEQVRSILHQTTPPAQIVLSDDASSDATVATVRDIIARARAERPHLPLQLTVLKNDEPLGITANFQQAVAACTGELIALCDQDDVWAANRIELVSAQFAERPDLTLLHSDARLVDEHGDALGHQLFEAIRFTRSEMRAIRSGNALKVLLQRNVVTGATTVFRRGLLDAALPFPESWVHDEWLAVVAAVTGRVDFLTEPLVDYRQHGANQIGAEKPTMKQIADRLLQPRVERNATLLSRAQELADRAPQLTGDGAGKQRRDILNVAAAKLSHEQARSALPATRALRIVPVLRELLTGRYHRYGRARFDVVRDLLQPAQAHTKSSNDAR